MSRQILAAIFLGACVVTPVSAQGTRLLRTPTVSETQIAFVHANDIWVAPRGGGTAYRLTSDIGGESHPHFSDDGRTIAFSAQYGGNTDVYVVPAQGGQPERLPVLRFVRHPPMERNHVCVIPLVPVKLSREVLISSLGIRRVDMKLLQYPN